ncbi:hypothetical protein [Pedobacter sp. GR22-6]|uniref:hypothetical protein n=1 Tax=Pedobacter sp. GR22-6 TaxID=3127957 RepID=UPI00307CD267
MTHQETISLLEIIDQQVSSSILGGMEDQYEELERLGYVVIDRHSVQHAASITPEGLEFLHHTSTEGTGVNRPVPSAGSVIVVNEHMDEEARLSDEPDSLGVDLDGTNPGSNKHPMD